MRHKATLLPGDGIGPEVCQSAVEILEAAGVEMDWQVIERHEPKPDEPVDQFLRDAVESVRRTRVALKGPMTTPIGVGHRSLNLALPQGLEPTDNPPPGRNIEGVASHFTERSHVTVRRDQ